IPAAVVCAPQAGRAASAGDARPDTDQLARLKSGGAACSRLKIDLLYPAHNLMPQDAGILQVPVPLIEHLDVRSTDSAGLDPDQRPSRRATGIGQVHQLQVLWAFQHRCLHNYVLGPTSLEARPSSTPGRSHGPADP